MQRAVQRGRAGGPPLLRGALALCGAVVLCGIVAHTLHFQRQPGGGGGKQPPPSRQQPARNAQGGDTRSSVDALAQHGAAEGREQPGGDSGESSSEDGLGADSQEVAELRAEVARLEQERLRLQTEAAQRCATQSTASGAAGGGPSAAGLAPWVDEAEWSVPGWQEDTNFRLVHGKPGDRSRLEPAGKCAADKALGGITFLTRDICQLGHSPKDATHLFVYLAQGGHVDRIVFGSDCMTRNDSRSGLAGPAYSRTWHDATKHWFGAVLQGWGGTPERLHSESLKEVCLGRAVTRMETWRWFPGQRTAHAFRVLLTKHLRLRPPPREYGKGRLRVSIVRRLEDRSFEEDKVGQYISSKFGKVMEPKVVFFDNKDLHGRMLANVSALSYLEQLQLMTESDIFIAAHGAAMTNVITMQRGTAVIELFPNNFRYYMFEELIRMLGLHYFPYEADTPQAKCQGCPGRRGAPPLTDPRDFHGSKKCKKCPIRVPEIEWYYLVKNAASAVWLSLSRRQSVHLFDQRRTR